MRFCLQNIKGLSKEAIDEFYPVEELQIFQLLPYPDVLNRYPELIRDPDNDAAFSRPIEFGKGYGIDFRSGRELLCLLDRILSGGSIEDQEDLMGSFRDQFLDHFTDLRSAE